MTTTTIIGFINLLCVGLFAGEEFTIRYGVRAAIASLDTRPHIQIRQALIRRLRILVPAIFGLSVLSGIAVTIANGIDSGFGLRCAGLLALLTFIVVTLRGTAPINQAALTWDASAPPANWRGLIRTWEQLDDVRCWVILITFILFLAAILLHT